MPNVIKLDTTGLCRAEWVAERDEILTELAEVEAIDSDSQFEAAGALQTRAAKHAKKLDKIRMEVKRPALDFSKAIDTQAKEMVNELKAGTDRIRKINGDYATKKQAEADAEARRVAQEEARKAQEEAIKAQEQAEAAPVTFGGKVVDIAEEPAPAQFAPPPPPPPKTKTMNNTSVKVWDFEIVDKNKIPAEFLVVDEKKIRAFIKYITTNGDTPEIEGVKITSRIDIRSR